METEESINRARWKGLKAEKLELLNLENVFAETIAQNYEEFFQILPANECYKTAKKFLARSAIPVIDQHSINAARGVSP